MTEGAALLGALGALLALAGRSRLVILAGLMALGAAEAGLASGLVDGGLVDTALSRKGVLLAAAGIPLGGGLAVLFARYPAVVPLAVVAAAPFRLPFDFGSGNRFLIGIRDSAQLGRLIPLYVVVAAAAAALAWRALRERELRSLPRALTIPLALLAALMIVSALWATDAAAAEQRLTFFVVPFVVLFLVVAHAPFRPWLPRALAIEVVGLAVLFAAVGVVEAALRETLFQDPKIATANSYTSYFRVTSLFDDPSIYGRHVAIGIAVVVAALWLGRIAFWPGAALVAFLWGGLFFSYSQSSMVALIAGVVAVSLVTADLRVRRVLAGATIVVALAGGAAFGLLIRAESADRVTSDRWTLLSDTATVVGNHPLAGVGIAGQPSATRDEVYGRGSPDAHVSHTTPLTVAAEHGILGFVVYLVVLAGAVWTLLLARREHEAVGLGLIAAFVVLVVHSLFYGLFFEDPFTWSVLALAAGYAARSELAREALPFRRLALPGLGRPSVSRAR